MKKTLLRLSVLAVIAGAGQFSTASAFTGTPDTHALQAAPNRLQQGWFGNLFKKLTLPVRVQLGVIPPKDVSDIIEDIDSDFPPIPPGFFDPGSAPFYGGVKSGGEEESDQPDTAVQRSSEMIFVDPVSQPIPIELVQLNLVSVEPITVTVDPLAPPVPIEKYEPPLPETNDFGR